MLTNIKRFNLKSYFLPAILTALLFIFVASFNVVFASSYIIALLPPPTPTSGNAPTPTAKLKSTLTPTPTINPNATYAINGTVYIDNNRNGVQDGGERGYANAGVYLSSGQTTTTNSSGAFSFANMHKGVYVVGLTIPSGYSPTTTNPAVSQILYDRATVNFGIK